MRSDNRNISRENIDLEIYKTFEQFKQIKDIRIVDFLNKFNVTIFKNREYRSIDYNYDSLIRLILFQRLKGIRFQTELVRYLKTHPKEKHKLGFIKTPNQRTISNFLCRIVDKETKKLLKYTAYKIEKISEKFGIIIDVKTLEPDKPKKTTKIRNQYLQKKEKTNEICRLVKKRFSPFINLNLNHNTIYTKNQFIDLMIHLGQTRDFAENGNKTFKELRTYDCPDADTLLYHLKNYSDYKQLHKMFITIFEIIWEMARKTNTFDIRRQFDVAIDFTEWYFYGDRGSPMVVGKEQDRGTTKCYKFATINIVESGKRFTLLSLPVGPFDEKEKILSQLLSYALQRIKIRRVYVDRGFFDSKTIKVFHRFHLKYLMPATKIPTVKEIMEITTAPRIITSFPMKDVAFNLVIVEEKLKDGNKVKRAFVTNEEYNESDVNLAERLFDLYGKRWGVETSYRVKKQSYLPRTTSKNYLIRLFYFMFSVLLYNLWILADILIWIALFGLVEEDHLITSKYFGTVLYTVDKND
jgi:putative transposase